MSSQNFSRREFLKAVGVGAAAVASNPNTILARVGQTARRPNVVFIYTDDQDFNEVGCYGGAVLTPHIDSLARDGIKFSRGYISAAVCTPSRFGSLTGQYASRSKHLQEQFPPGGPARIMWNTSLSDGEITLPAVLQQNGYKTGMVGKWMQGAPKGKPVNENADHSAPEVVRQLKDNYDQLIAAIKSRGFDYAASAYITNIPTIGLPLSLQEHNMDWVTKGALDFIDQNKDHPFFLYMPTTLPHGPNNLKSLKSDPRITPVGMLPRQLDVQPSRKSVLERSRAAGVADRLIPFTWLDDGVGAVLKRLDDLELAENTVVIFVSDHQSRGKLCCYEGARVPFLVRWKGVIEGGLECDELISNVDLAPTIFDICGITPPREMHLDGRSFLPLLKGGKPADWRDSLYLEITYTRAVVSDDGWKYIALRYPEEVQKSVDGGNRREFSQDGSKNIRYRADQHFPAYFDYDQLYNLKQDPQEQINLADNPRYEAKLGQMKAVLKEYCADLPHTFGEFRS